MPKIRWADLPPTLREHLFDRVADRQISAEELYKLKAWRESEPDAPEGPWFKDFGSFKICGEGQYPRHSYCAVRLHAVTRSSKRWFQQRLIPSCHSAFGLPIAAKYPE